MSAIKVVEVEDDYNIQEAWNRACGAFAQTTKVNLTESPKFTVDEVLDQIRAKQDEDDEKSNKYRVAKDVIGKTLKFITVLGGIAAQGASMVSRLAPKAKTNTGTDTNSRSSLRAAFASMRFHISFPQEPSTSASSVAWLSSSGKSLMYWSDARSICGSRLRLWTLLCARSSTRNSSALWISVHCQLRF